jgi:serine/threonine-protein kinase
MDTVSWERIQELFHEASGRPESERQAFLEAACGGDSEIMSELLTMLEADSRTASLLDGGLPAIASRVMASPPPIGEFGPYRLKRILGEGGMGVVWLAEREDAGNLVAIKFLPHAGLSPARRERFAREIKTLAKLKHPYIARLYDAGTLTDGTPWFVMEYVEGVHFTEYCRVRQRGVDELLRLFRSVCEAVQYAHGQEIIHRDLKPSNILVEADGTLRLLDFGIARELQNRDEPAEQTRPGLRFLSQDYAAPEWVHHGTVGFTTDVYSLGVILYETLAGRLPLKRDDGTERPSIASTLTRSKAEWSDLDVMCLKAMHPNPKERYPSVEALIRDIDHYLKQEPLEARRDSFRYHMDKFIARNRRAVWVTAAGFLLAIALIVFFTVRLAEARDAAIAEAARTKRIQNLMLSLFGAGDQEAGPANQLRVVEFLDRGARQAATLSADPVSQAELYQTLGTIYQRLGKLPQAERLLQSAVERMKAGAGPEDARVADAMLQLGLLRGDQARFKDAEQWMRQGLDVASRRLPPGDPEVLKAHWALGQIMAQSGAYDQAITVLDPLVHMKPSGVGAADVTLADSLTALGYARQYTGRFDLAESLDRRALELDQRLFGQSHPRVAIDLANIGTTEISVGKNAEAENSYRRALDIMTAWYGSEHPQTAEMSSFLALALTRQSKYDGAAPLLRHALAINEHALGKDNPIVANILDAMGQLARRQGNLAEAEADQAAPYPSTGLPSATIIT